jgi:NIPSNAP
MIIDHRTYHVAHGRMQEYLTRYEKEGLPLQMKYLGHLVGYFVSDIGPLNQVVHLWAYESIADREERRARMAADPQWRAFLDGNAGLFTHQEIKILKPTSFSPLR